jgi:flavodoxin
MFTVPATTPSPAPRFVAPTQANPAISHPHIDRTSVTVLVVVYESTRGHAAGAAGVLADALTAHGVTVVVRCIADIEPGDTQNADAIIAGCWTPGRAPFGDEPCRNLASWIEELQPLQGKPVGLFCTYRFFAHTFADMATRTAETERELETRFERRGAKVAAKRSLHFRSVEDDAPQLVEKVLEYVLTS